MTSEIRRFFLEFNEPFSIAHGSRTGTDLVLLRIEHLGVEAWGEASLPPYLPETQDSVSEFISGFFRDWSGPDVGYHQLHQELMNYRPAHFAAKACVDIALCNWHAKQRGVPVWKWLGLDDRPLPLCTYTIGMGTTEEVQKKAAAAKGFSMLKVKLGGDHDLDIVRAIRSVSSKMICVDVNQGWKSREVALEMILRLQELGVAFVEQPLPKHLHDDMEWLKQKSPLPLFADESAQTPADVAMIGKGFHGVNVKLMKCGGITEGLKMVREAKKNGLQVLVGSMSETSCGILAAAQLTSLADYADLDGPMLTRNNPFQRPEYREGRLLI